MYDIFLMEDVQQLLKNKSVVFLGDSNIRALYKDLLCLLHCSEFIPESQLKKKMENSLFGDQLVYHGRQTNGRCYREEREASVDGTRISFFFLTRVYDNYVRDVVDRITRRSKPDVVIINSCVWDITRWGCDGVYDYKRNLKYLMKEFRWLLPDCLVIWVTTPPLAAEVRGGFLVKELQFLKYSLRFHVVEANHFARKVVVDNGFDVLDTHFHLQMQIHRRSPDGIHWFTKAVRYITNLILRHISLSWNVPLPHRYESSVIDENLVSAEDSKDSRIIKLAKKNDADEVKQDRSKESDVPDLREKLKSKVTAENKKEETKKRRRSIQLYRAPKREESIHKHMAKAETKRRRTRIREWKKSLPGGSPKSSRKSKSKKKKAASDKSHQRQAHEASLSNESSHPHKKSLNAVPPSDSNSNSLKATSNTSLQHKVPLLPSPSEIPLPPYSPGDEQSYNSQMQSNQSQVPSFSGWNDFDYPLITSPSQIPLPPDSPCNQQSQNSCMQNEEYPLSSYNRSNDFKRPLISSPNPVPLPTYSYGNQQSYDYHMQSNEHQLPSFNRSNDFDFSLINSPGLIQLPPYNPSHCQTGGSSVRKVEYQPQLSNRSNHFDYPVITSPSQIPCSPYNQLGHATPQRRVVDYQTTRWASSGFSKKATSSSQSFLNQQFRQRKKIFGRVDISNKPYQFPNVMPGQILQPRFDFSEDEMSQNYLF